MKQKLIKIISLLTLVFLGSWGTSFAATIILTNTTDTIETFRTNYNTTVTNLNNAIGSSVTSITAGDGLLGGTITSTGTIYGQVGTSTLPVLGQLTYWAGLGTATSPAKLASTATSTLTGTGPISVSNTPYIIGGSGAVVSCTNASAGVTGCLTGTDWSTFNNKGSGSVTSITAGDGLLGGIITTSGTIYGQVGTSTTPVLGQIPYYSALGTATSPAKLTSIATSSISVSVGLTNTGTLGSQIGGSALTLKQIENRSFTYATSSAWTGTTTIPLEVGYNEVWNTLKCFTDTGTLNVQFGYGTASTTLFNASTTIGTVAATPNNTMTSGNKVVVDIGTPASTPTKITCSVNDTI